MTTSIQEYFEKGCMRCPLGGTDACKVMTWVDELKTLRSVLLDSELTESIKWGVPCYTINNGNVLLLTAFKEFVALSFFKGALITDKDQLLVKPGPSTQASRYLKFTNLEQIIKSTDIITAYVKEAIQIELQGLKVDFQKTPEPLPQELIDKMEEDPIFKSAFEALTPGRQRGYILYFSKAKQSQTRINRIQKYESLILNGRGMHDHYTS